MIRLLAAAILAALSLTSPLPHADAGAPSLAQAAAVALTDAEKQLIGRYFQRQYDVWAAAQSPGTGKKSHGALPPGLAQKGAVAPGLATQLARNGKLPPGLTKHDVPDDLLAQLQPLPAGYELIVVDDRVLLIETATSLILDIVTVAAADAS